jgi:hypothetical protein
LRCGSVTQALYHLSSLKRKTPTEAGASSERHSLRTEDYVVLLYKTQPTKTRFIVLILIVNSKSKKKAPTEAGAEESLSILNRT